MTVNLVNKSQCKSLTFVLNLNLELASMPTYRSLIHTYLNINRSFCNRKTLGQLLVNARSTKVKPRRFTAYTASMPFLINYLVLFEVLGHLFMPSIPLRQIVKIGQLFKKSTQFHLSLWPLNYPSNNIPKFMEFWP